MYARRFLLSAIVSVGIMTASHSSAFAQGAPLFAVLNGGNEVTAAGVARAGDLDAFGSATITFAPSTVANSTTLCFAILAVNILPATAAHIHRGTSGVNGAVVVGLAPPLGTPGRVANCIPVSTPLANEIRFFPDRFYVNVHNAAFPNGAIRGQLF